MFNVLKTYWHSFKRTRMNVNVLKKGQDNNYAILQTAHRLEKGLCISKPRNLWGWDKANELFELVNKEIHKNDTDLFAVKVGSSVLSAFVESKKCSNNAEDKSRAKGFEFKIEELKKNVFENWGGLFNNPYFRKFISGRSCQNPS